MAGALRTRESTTSHWLKKRGAVCSLCTEKHWPKAVQKREGALAAPAKSASVTSPKPHAFTNFVNSRCDDVGVNQRPCPRESSSSDNAGRVRASVRCPDIH